MEQLSSTSVSCHALSAAYAPRAAHAWSHLVFLCVTPAMCESIPPHDPVWPGWLAPCYQLTPRVQRLSATAVLLDLGICTETEAVSVVAGLLRRLENMRISVRVGIAPTAILAQLALLTAPSRRQIVSVTPQGAPRLVRHIPVAILSQLLPQGAITAEVVSRLQRYGLSTLGHVATLTESALHQQFGHAGGELAALAQGHDRCPFSPTPSPRRLRFDMRLPIAMPPQQALPALPAWAQQIAGCLKKANLAVRELHLTLSQLAKVVDQVKGCSVLGAKVDFELGEQRLVACYRWSRSFHQR